MRPHLPRHLIARLSLALAVPLTLLLAACGGNSAGVASTAARAPSDSHSALGNGQTSASAGASGQDAKTTTAPPGPQFLIKSLGVNLAVKDTLKTADEIESWITTTDTRATTAGQDRVQSDDGAYDVTIKFSVQAALYPQVSHYLSGYAAAHDGKLLNLHESVQDVTGDVVDTQSRLTNLKGEQQRLLTLMNQATNLGDVLTIEQRLTDVEGQIESIEAHLNSLTGQTTFYDVTVNLAPLGAATPSTGNQPWQPLQILQNALGAALAFAQVLATIAIWLIVFSVFIVPAGLLTLYVRRRLARRAAAIPAPATSA